MRTNRQNAANRRRDGVTGAPLIAGCGDDESVAPNRLLKSAAQSGRERQEVGLLRGTDVEDIGAGIERLADSGGEIVLAASMLSVGCHRIEDRDGDKPATGGKSRHKAIGRPSKDRIDLRPVFDNAGGY